jgi:23S rRNA pseudouridine1911/1915/1917 synthase
MVREMRTVRFTVGDAETGSRLDKALAARDEIGSRTLAERLLRRGAVRVDGVVRPKSHRLGHGALVDVELPDADHEIVGEEVTVRVLYEDPHFLVVDKPAGIAVHGGAGEAHTLVGQLLTLGAAGGPDPERPGVVHRLDRNTSGLLLVARSDEAHAALQGAIRRHEVERRYYALVRGHPKSRTGRIDAPMGRDRRDPTRRSLDTEEPREAATLFEVVETTGEHTLLEARLETGRTHQIRVHLAAIGLPVVGDSQYGVGKDLGLERQFLHAHRLRLRHPLTGAELDISSELPPDLQEALEAARAD